MTNNFLTKEGFQKLQDELDYLRTAKRQEVANRLHEAMEGGELIENAEYEAAKNEQAFVEGRIQELDLLLATAKIIEENGKTYLVVKEPRMYNIINNAKFGRATLKLTSSSPSFGAFAYTFTSDCKESE